MARACAEAGLEAWAWWLLGATEVALARVAAGVMGAEEAAGTEAEGCCSVALNLRDSPRPEFVEYISSLYGST